jgi:hypothetical protein
LTAAQKATTVETTQPIKCLDQSAAIADCFGDVSVFIQPSGNTVLHAGFQGLPSTKHLAIKVSDSFFLTLRVKICGNGVTRAKTVWLQEGSQAESNHNDCWANQMF